MFKRLVSLFIFIYFTGSVLVYADFENEIERFQKQNIEIQKIYISDLQKLKDEYYGNLSNQMKKKIDKYNSILEKKLVNSEKQIELLNRIEKLLATKKGKAYKHILAPILYHQKINILQKVSQENYGKNVTLQSIDQHTFKVATYTQDPKIAVYDIQSYGSAVMIGANKLITNAHVVLNENDKVQDLVTVCYSQKFSDTPKCKYIGNVTHYDKKKDIAIIELRDKDIFGQKIPNYISNINILDTQLSLGSQVNIYGFPSIGGNTITFTEGKISGKIEGKYKTDAIIDHGNSGGGAFDVQGNLIGITVSIITDNNTIGYIIPAEDIKNFLNNIQDYEIESNDINSINLKGVDALKKEYVYENKNKLDYQEKGLIIKNIFEGYEESEYDLFYSEFTDYINIKLETGDYFSVIQGKLLGGDFNKNQLNTYLKDYFYGGYIQEDSCEKKDIYTSCYVKVGDEHESYLKYQVNDSSITVFYIDISSNEMNELKAEEFLDNFIQEKVEYYDINSMDQIQFKDMLIDDTADFITFVDVDYNAYYPDYQLVLLPTSTKYDYIGSIRFSDDKSDELKISFQDNTLSKKDFYDNLVENLKLRLQEMGYDDIQVSLKFNRSGQPYIESFSNASKYINFSFINKDFELYNISFSGKRELYNYIGKLNDSLNNIEFSNIY